MAANAEGRGIGTALLEAAGDRGRSSNFRRLTLSVFAGNRRAAEFYARQGWRPELEMHHKRRER